MGKRGREPTDAVGEVQNGADLSQSTSLAAPTSADKSSRKSKKKAKGVADEERQPGTPPSKRAKKSKKDKSGHLEDRKNEKKKKKHRNPDAMEDGASTQAGISQDVHASQAALTSAENKRDFEKGGGSSVKIKKREKDSKAKTEKKKRRKSETIENELVTGSTQDGSRMKGVLKQAEQPGNGALARRSDRLHPPSVDEILSKGVKKRKGFLHGHANIPLFSKEQIRALSLQDQHSSIKSVATLCERLMDLLHETISVTNRWTKSDAKHDLTSIEEALTNDLVRLKKLPFAKQYVEMTLWHRVAQLNRDQLQAASRLGFGKGSVAKGSESLRNPGLLLHCDDDPDAEFVSYRDAYMNSIVERFGDDLETMRQAEDMDANRVQFLLRCLDSGASLFGNLKCLEKKQAHG